MIVCKLAVCGETAVLDKESNNASIVNILLHMQVQGFPIIIQKFGCVFMLERDEGDPETPDTSLRITIDDNELHTVPLAIDFQDKTHSTTIVKLHGVVFPRPGIAAVRLLLKGEEIGRWEFEFRQIHSEPKLEVEQG